MLFKSVSRHELAYPARRFLSSYLRDRYGFIPPPSLVPSDPNPSSPADSSWKKKKKKPPYKPPSSLNLAGRKPVHSDLPFDFRFSYTESSPLTKPIGLREPKYSPFGPGALDRTWTGVCAPAVDPTVLSVDEGMPKVDEEEVEVRKKRERILGEPLTPAERSFLIDKCQKHKTKRQVNLGRDGLTHNMLNDIHNNWKHAEAVRIKCLGVPTVDMKNVCTQLEEKTGGLIIHRHGGQIILYRGRHYNPKKRPVIPLMLWKPHDPIYPRLIKTVIDGLAVEETKEMRKRGLAIPALTKLDCKGLPKSDYKKIGVKLRDLVPCVPVTFDKEQIVVWRGKNYSSATQVNSELKSFPQVSGSDVDVENSNGAPDQSSDENLFSRSSDGSEPDQSTDSE